MNKIPIDDYRRFLFNLPSLPKENGESQNGLMHKYYLLVVFPLWAQNKLINFKCEDMNGNQLVDFKLTSEKYNQLGEITTPVYKLEESQINRLIKKVNRMNYEKGTEISYIFGMRKEQLFEREKNITKIRRLLTAYDSVIGIDDDTIHYFGSGKSELIKILEQTTKIEVYKLRKAKKEYNKTRKTIEERNVPNTKQITKIMNKQEIKIGKESITTIDDLNFL